VAEARRYGDRPWTAVADGHYGFSCRLRPRTPTALCCRAQAHPGHYFRNPKRVAVSSTLYCHHRDSVAREVGVPGPTTMVRSVRPGWRRWSRTGGDDAIISGLRGELRRFNVAATRPGLRAPSAASNVKDGYALVDIDIVGENQRGDLTRRVWPRAFAARNVNHRLALTGRTSTSNCYSAVAAPRCKKQRMSGGVRLL